MILFLISCCSRRSTSTRWGRCASARGLDWWRAAVDLRPAEPGDRPVRRRGVAICGQGTQPTQVCLVPDLPLPERTLVARVELGGTSVTVALYYAPPGVSWFEKKPQQAVGFAQWLKTVNGPILFGADANTPLVDAIDFAATRTHWHSGLRKLKKAPGDDLLVGPAKIHQLDDALRRWLATHPAAIADLKADRPDGPLRVSFRTGKNHGKAGTDRRFDSIWVSPEFNVSAIEYPYDSCIAAGSDHSAVIADIEISPSPAQGGPSRE